MKKKEDCKIHNTIDPDCAGFCFECEKDWMRKHWIENDTPFMESGFVRVSGCECGYCKMLERNGIAVGRMV